MFPKSIPAHLFALFFTGLCLFKADPSSSQCTVSANASPINASCGDTIALSAVGNTGNVVLGDDFNGQTLAPGWSSNTTVDYYQSLSCLEDPSNDGTYFAWLGPSTSQPRILTTTDYDVSCGGQVCFDFIMASENTSGSPCEGPDWVDEGVSLQYSTDGGATWNEIFYFNPDTNGTGGNSNSPLVYWENYCFNIPPAAQTNNTMFRWYQGTTSGINYDHWGLDNVQIFANDCSYWYDWSHVPGYPDSTQETAIVNSDSTFTVIYTNGTDSCQSSVTVNVLFPNVSASTSEDTVCEGQSVTLDAQLTNIPPDTCCYTLDMDDSYGDGWNGGYIEVFVNSSSIGTFSASGSGSIEQFCVSDGENIELQYTSGSWESENTYTLFDPNGNAIFSDGPTPNTGSVYTTTANCGTTTYDVSWNPTTGLTSPNDSTTSATVNSTTTYAVDVTDPNNPTCLSTDSVTVTVTQVLPAIALPDTLTCTQTSVVLDGSASTTTSGNMDFSWSTSTGNIVSGASTATPTVDAAGSYTLTLTDPSAGCSKDSTITVEIDTVSPTAVIALPDTLTCTTTSVTLDGSGSTSNSGNLSYSWSNGGTGQTTTVSAAGTHTLTVTDPANGCTHTTSTVVEIDTISPTAVIALPDTLTCTTTSVTLDGSGSTSNSGNLSYSWSNGGTGQTTTVSSAGSYSLTVTDPANGCTHTTSTVVEIDTISPTAVIALPDTLTCITTSVTLDGSGSTSNSGNLSYSWSNGGTGQTTTVSSAGSYSLTVTDPANGCTHTTSTVVEIDTVSPTIAFATPDTFYCSTTSVTLDATSSSTNSGNASYSWSTPNGSINSGSNTATPTVGSIGDYVLVLTDPANGCSIEDTLTVIQDNSIPVADAGMDTILPCVPSSIQLDGTGSDSGPSIYYSWGTNGGNIVNGGTTTTPEVDQVGSYYITLTDSTNNCQASDTVVVSAPPVLSHSVNISDLLCYQDSTGEIAINASGGDGNYQYSIDNGATFQGGNTFTGLSAGVYDVVVQDGYGCESYSQDTIVQPSPLVISNFNVDSVTCNGLCDGSVSVFPAGGTENNQYEFNWSGGIGGQFEAQPDSVCAGSYSVTIMDDNGCTVDTSFSVGEPAALGLTTSSTNANCYNADGSASVDNVTGGSSPYSYQWDDGNSQTTATASNLTPGDYAVTVTDANGCSIVDTVTVMNNSAQSVTISNVSNTSCNGGCDGSISLSVTGGVTPYTYQWDDPNNQTSQTATGLCAGTYSVAVTDANGCVDSATATVDQPTRVEVTASPDTTICIGGTASISANGTGGTPGYTYHWDQGLGTGQVQNVSPNSQTTYTVYAEDANGCTSDSATVTVSFLQPLTVTTTQSDSICPGETVQLSATASGGDGNYSFSWSNGDQGSSIIVSPSSQTQYVVTVDDGCETPTAMDTVEVFLHSLPNVQIGGSNLSGCAPVNATLVNQTPPYMVGSNCVWEFGDGEQATGCDSVIHSFQDPGCYDVSLTVTSPEGCVDSATAQNLVCVYPYPDASFEFGPQPTTIQDPLIDFTNTSIGADQYSWDFAGSDTSSQEHPSFEFPASGEGAYPVCLTATSTYGCVDSVCHTVHIGGEFIVYVPNSFTPDGDGINDEFGPVIQGYDESEYSFYVFDRWGEIVFESHHPDNKWNGRVKGTSTKAKSDAYVWKLIAKDKFTGKTIERVGHVNLIR